MTIRIRRSDSRNIVIEKWVKGGYDFDALIARPDRWVIYGYYHRIQDIATGLLDAELKLPKSDKLDVKELIQAVNEAKIAILEQLKTLELAQDASQGKLDSKVQS